MSSFPNCCPDDSAVCQTVVVALGSNFEAEKNIRLALRQLESEFGEITVSRILRTKPIGLEGSGDFLNALAQFRTGLEYKELESRLKQIETLCGRSHTVKSADIAIDLDILLYGKERHHEADWQRPYIKTLSKELLDQET